MPAFTVRRAQFTIHVPRVIEHLRDRHASFAAVLRHVAVLSNISAMASGQAVGARCGRASKDFCESALARGGIRGRATLAARVAPSGSLASASRTPAHRGRRVPRTREAAA